MFSLKKQIPPNKKITFPKTKYGITTLYYENIEPIGIRNVAEEKIIKSDKIYHLQGFMTQSVIEKDNTERLQSFSIFGGIHPNADYETGVFCMPDYMKHKPICKELIYDIRIVLRIWNLLSCFFIPDKNTYESVKI